MRKILLALSLSVVPLLSAQTADLRILTASLSHAPTLTGERVALSMRWRNDGPATANTVHLSVNGTPTPFYVLSVATSGWPCYPNPEGTSFLCQNPALPAGAEADLVLQLLTPPTAGTFTLRAQLSAEENDPTPANNVAVFTADLTAAPAADLAITPNSQTLRVAEGDATVMPLFVTNHGSVAVRNVIAYFNTPVVSTPQPFTVEGEGWSCGHLAYGPQAVICTRSSIGAGETAPITLRAEAPAEDFTFHARVRGELHSDPLTANDTATATLEVGPRETEEPEEEGWARILIPLGGEDVPGTNQSLWRVENTGIILSDEPIEFFAEPCPSPVPCHQPLREVFDLRVFEIGGWNNTGTIVRVRPSQAGKLRLNSRVYDVSRQEQTAGAEIPIVREDEFSLDPISIVGIPVAAHYRHTLRVYDLDNRNDARVRIRIYADEETTPRETLVRSLTPGPQMPGELPAMPGYLQLELGQLVPLAGIEKFRVDVEPLTSGLVFWAFVSVTNNATHHVTTFAAQ